MARIDYSDPAKASDRTREILGKNRNANIFRMMAHSPSYFEQYCRLGGAIRHKGELDPSAPAGVSVALAKRRLPPDAFRGASRRSRFKCTARGSVANTLNRLRNHAR